jgi:hypothetical protein
MYLLASTYQLLRGWFDPSIEVAPVSKKHKAKALQAKTQRIDLRYQRKLIRI